MDESETYYDHALKVSNVPVLHSPDLNEGIGSVSYHHDESDSALIRARR